MAKIRICDLHKARTGALVACQRYWRFRGSYGNFLIDCCDPCGKEIQTLSNAGRIKGYEQAEAWAAAGFPVGGGKRPKLPMRDLDPEGPEAPARKGKGSAYAFKVVDWIDGFAVQNGKGKNLFKNASKEACVEFKNALNDDPGIADDRKALANLARGIAESKAEAAGERAAEDLADQDGEPGLTGAALKRANKKFAKEMAKSKKEEPELEMSEELLDGFDALLTELSPENLSGDGEITGRALVWKRDEIMKRWARLEKKAGRRFGTDEMEQIVAAFRKESKA